MSKRGIVFDSKDPKSVSRTEQCHANECDINTIVARAEKGIFPLARGNEPFFGDFMNVDLAEMLNTTREANARFMMLPPMVRAKFDNDPAKLVDFLLDDKNRAEARELGLIPSDDNVAPSKTIVNDKAGAEGGGDKPPEGGASA